MDRQQREVGELELTVDELDAVSGGMRNGETKLFHAFIGGLIKGYMDAGGKVTVDFH